MCYYRFAELAQDSGGVSDIVDIQKNMDERFMDIFSKLTVVSNMPATPSLDAHNSLSIILFRDSKDESGLDSFGSFEKLKKLQITGGIRMTRNPLQNYNERFTTFQCPTWAWRYFSDAINAVGPIAKVVMYLRFFEAGFNMRHGKLAKPLQKFLNSGKMQIDRNAIEEWIKMRHAGAHGWGQHSRDSPYEIFQHLAFMHTAACDVIANKKNWGSSDALRINHAHLRGGDPDTPQKAQVNIEFLDGSGAWICREAMGSDGRLLVFPILDFVKYHFPTVNIEDAYRIDSKPARRLIDVELVANRNRHDPERIKFGPLHFGIRPKGELSLSIRVDQNGRSVSV